MGASSNQSREQRLRPVRNRNIVAGVLAGVIRNWLTDPGPPRSHLFTSLWIEIKRYGASRISNIELSQIRGIDRVRVDGPVRRHSPLIVAALSTLLECETVFELGPDMGDTAWLLAHNLPNARIYLLNEGTDSDQPKHAPADRLYHLSRGEHGARFDTTPEASRITRLPGDSATFDFLPYSGTA